MLTEIRNVLKNNPSALWILAAGLVIQLITCFTAIGVSSADQHFQIVEFSLYQLGEPSGASQVWEIDNFVRPTLQVYLFSAYHVACNYVGIADPYAQLTILRVVLGLFMFAVFNAMAFFYFRNRPAKELLIVLALMNFTWALPYTRTLFSSEMMSSLFFFGTLLLYEYKKDRQPGVMMLMLVGFLFSLAFYFRFQAAFGMAGVAVWLLFFEKKYRHILPLAAGFVIGVLINVVLDRGFYGEWLFTPYTYFHANIIAGRADYFGTSSFLRYIGLLLLVAPAPLFSFVVLYAALRYFFKNIGNPLLLSVVIFIICHSLVGHKEERFLFPVFNALPIITGWSIPYLQSLLTSRKKVLAGVMKGLLYFTIVLNGILLIVMTLVPFSQTILFSRKVSEKFEGSRPELYCVGQTPFETPNGSQMEFYKRAAENISIKKLKNFNELLLVNENPRYVSASFGAVGDYQDEMISLGYEPVMYSSGILWKLDNWLRSKNIQTIPEIWALYEKKGENQDQK